ncbi:MAG: molybdopterin oxidoreductase family protein [Burkholderiales bacterium]
MDSPLLFAGSGESKVVRAACPHDCPDTCAMLVTVENGVAIEVKGAPDHPTTQGTLCTKVARYLDRTYSDQRLQYPMKRIGNKGEGKFARISWDEALDTITKNFKIIAQDNPQSIVPYSYAGTMGLVQGESMDRRFFHKLGASLLDRTICATAGGEGYMATIGAKIGTDVEQFDNAKLIIIWGSNPIVSNLHLWSRVQEAKRRGAKLIAIDPYRSLTAEKCHEHLAIIPGSDAALALGMMHVLITDNLQDIDYINKFTIGYKQLVVRVKQYSPTVVAKLTGISAEKIIRLARDYASIKPAVIRLNYGMQRHAGGGMAVRAIACLPALIGAWRDAAGGILLSTSGTYGVNTQALQRPDLIWNNPRTINMSAIGDALLKADPPVRALYVYNSNPVAVAPDSSKVIAGFARENLFTVVHDSFQTDTADYADILLPATTQLEQVDVHKSYGHLYALANNQSIAPLAEAKANSEVFRLLAARMGFEDPCFKESDDDIARNAFLPEHKNMQGISWETLKQQGWQRLNVAKDFAPFAYGGFPTPSGKCEFYSETLKARGMDPLPTYTPPRESLQSSPELAKKYPLAIISPPSRNLLNSTFANLPKFIQEEKEPRLEIHPVDAAARNISDGNMVRAFNDRGSFCVKARVTDKALPGVVIALSVWWKKLSPDGRNANEVTSQGLTDMGAAATFYDALVQVELASPLPG